MFLATVINTYDHNQSQYSGFLKLVSHDALFPGQGSTFEWNRVGDLIEINNR